MELGQRAPGDSLCFCSHNFCLNTAPPPVPASLKCVSRDTVEESCFHQQQGEGKVSREGGKEARWRLPIDWGKEGWERRREEGPLDA